MEDQAPEEVPVTELPAVETPVQAPAEEKEEEAAPTKSVKNFWERLDEVFTQNTELRQRMEELVEQFPTEVKPQGNYTSYIFQPARISLTSNDDITPSSQSTNYNPALSPSSTNGHYPSEKFSSFRIRLKRPLRNIKSIQLLSCVVPNAVQNIPDNQTIFFYYKLRSVATANLGAWNSATSYEKGDIVNYLGQDYVCKTALSLNELPNAPNSFDWLAITLPADTTRPNYYDLNKEQLRYLALAPSTYYPYDYVTAGDTVNFFNRTYDDYEDLVNSLNYIMGTNIFNNDQYGMAFSYNETLNKIIMEPNPTEIASNYYYIPCGYEDPNVAEFMVGDLAGTITGFNGVDIDLKTQNLSQGLTLNLRLGYTWNGIFPDPFALANPWSSLDLQSALYWYMRARDPGYYPSPLIPDWPQDTITFNSYPDLVNTSCVRIYADFTLASTQDSLGSASPANTVIADGLLSIVPIATNNLGVSFYQNNFNNPLDKIPENLAEIGITMLNDQGAPYYLPNSATVLLELAVEYK